VEYDDECVDGEKRRFTAQVFAEDGVTPAVPVEVFFSWTTQVDLDAGIPPTVLRYGVDPEITEPVAGTFTVVVDSTGASPPLGNTILTGQFNVGSPVPDATIQGIGFRRILVKASPIANPLAA
jgi:hypothetical protein